MSGRVPDNRIGGLDGLRAIAALAVFGVHFNQIAGLDGQFGPLDIAHLFARGDHGVLLFFTLSGFLLSLPFWRARLAGESGPDLRVYALRRAARIVPAYYAALTILIVITGLWRFPAALPDLLLHYAFLFNYTEFSIFSLNPPFWTLAVEMQFYLLLPFIFLGLSRLTPGRAAGTILALCFVSYGAHYALVTAVDRIVEWPFNPYLAWVRPYGAVLTHSLLAHLPHFLFGVIAGWLFLRLGRLDRRGKAMAEAAFWVSAALTLVLVLIPPGSEIGIPFGRYGLPVVPALVAIMVLAVPSTRFAGTLLETAALRLAGAVSYGIYIYHVPCLNLVDRLMLRSGLDAPDHWLMFGTAGLTLTVLAAAVSYAAIERPALRLARKFRVANRPAPY